MTVRASGRGSIPVALTIAGSDSGGGAGIQADLKTFHQFGVFGTSVIVAVTAQNTRGVYDVHAIPRPSIEAQLRAVIEDLRPAAVKTGMLATAELLETVAGAAQAWKLEPLVVDPVMVSTSGDRLLASDAEAALRTALVPLASLVTPNVDEAAILAGRSITSAGDLEPAAREIIAMGAGAVLMKGGHLSGDDVPDLLVTAGGTRWYHHARVTTTSTHGTGCTLSAAVTARLAQGAALEAAVTDAIDFVHRAIAEAPALGGGNGPINHFVRAAVAQ